MTASWQIRYAASSTVAGSDRGEPSTTVSMSSPAACASAVRSSIRASVGAGALVVVPSSGRRSVSSTPRTSVSASPLARLIASSAGRACSGLESSRCSAELACTLIKEMLCASTSCNSRAIASRCSLRRACSASATYARRTRHTSVAAISTSIQAANASASPTLGVGPGSHQMLV